MSDRDKAALALAEALWDADAHASGWKPDEARFSDTTDRARHEIVLRAETVLAALRRKGHTVAPTPDDRDREVERIAAVLFDLYASPGRKAAPTGDDLRSEAAVLYDAGLRASGGD